MSVIEFDTQEELDDEFERIAELNYEHLNLMDEVKEKQSDLEYAKNQLADFYEEHKEILLAH